MIRKLATLLLLSLALVLSGCEQKKEADTEEKEKASSESAEGEPSEEAEGAEGEEPGEGQSSEGGDEAPAATGDGEGSDGAAAEGGEAADGEEAGEEGAAAEGAEEGEAGAVDRELLMKPEKAAQKAPDKFKVKFTTTKGDFVVEVDRSNAPLGADRLFTLVKIGFFEKLAIFRVLDGFVAQFGIHGDPEVSDVWQKATIKDDPVKGSNKKGTLVYATAGPDTRTTQFFVNYGDNSKLDSMGFAPLGEVVEGMEVVESFYSDYGEGAPRGSGPAQELIHTQGNAYLEKEFPKLDYIEGAEIIE